ncbi:MAG: translation initiation factor IF-1 [Proteobacteria bacterium]|nr:translation initiation factor IF-1 [Pseudomonadota bacterium]
MAGEEALRQVGTVVETLPNGMYALQMADGRRVVAHVSGRLRMGFSRLLAGDRVQVELTPYDLGRGRIVDRDK